MTFHCSNPDFHIRSIPENDTFAVRRQALCTSEIFRDMFACCGDDASEDTLDLHESTGSLVALLNLLHDPPHRPIQFKRDESNLIPKVWNDPKTVIPLPLLPALFKLADKYALPSDTVMDVLAEHLLAHAPDAPLRVYTFALSHGLPRSVVSDASQYLQPMANYRLSEVTAIPVEEYHRVIQLQDFRVRKLREYLLSEEIFPHGYGACSSHTRETEKLWHSKRMSLAAKVETLTDISGELEETVATQEPVQNCTVCRKACIAAVEMLRYKCRKIPRTVDKMRTVKGFED
ncbi:hypothetical protein D9757_006289 [Collybiopsis confluens]|uniref:Uncharacterized protein n=1 Tax=Collybiopsis confluens TaxID=2823264 RepID=A0A8H5HGV0_9AGAR|nr:hypothetical protein D9757_006289 [Collybiopsis confluens]